MILSVCNNSSVLQILYIIKIIIRTICVIVPLILLITLSISFAQGVMSAEINEILKKSIPKIVAAILVFLIPTFVNIITSITGSKGYIGCLNNATIEGIKQAKYDEVNVYIEKANSSLNRGDLSIAKSKINKLSDESQKEELLNKIKETESKISKIEEIMNYSENTITQEKYDEALAFANKLPDGNSKSSLLEKLENLKEALTPPTPSLGSGSVENNVSGNNIADYLKQHGSSVEEINSKIKSSVVKAKVGTRQAAVAAATTLIDTLSSYGYKIKYEWWGKYAQLGINPNWGSPLSPTQYARDCNDYAKTFKNDGANCWNNMRWYGFDCSGFAQWVVIQAMQNTSASYNGGTRHNFNLNKNYAQCKIGDPIYTTGHVAIIIRLDEANKSYVIAESSGGGVGYSSVKYTNAAWWCNHITIYSN